MTRGTLLRASTLLAALSTLAAPAQAQRVQMPVGFRLTWIGARWQADGKVIDASGRPTSAPVSYRMADPTVATVTPRGEVTAKKPGNTRLWGVSGRDSAFTLIVVDQWPANFTFSPAVVRFDALGARQALRVVASDSAGVPVVGGNVRPGVCRSVNERVASLANGEVVSVAAGSTWIRCSDRGMADSLRIDVQQRAVAAIITNRPVLTRQRAPGDTFSVRVAARDRMQKDVPDARPTWASLNPLVVSVDPVTGRGRAVGGGETRVIVQVGDVADSVTIQVSGPAIQVNTGPVVADSTPKSKASLIAQELFVYEGETTYVQINALDSAGAPVGLSNLTFRIVDTTIAGRVDTARVVGRKQGQSKLMVRYAGMLDSAFVNVRQRQTGAASTVAAAGGARTTFVMPTIADSAAQHQRALADVQRVINTDPNLTARQQNFMITANLTGSIADHYTRGDDGTVVENRTGPLVGGTASVTMFRRLEVVGAVRKGTLAPDDEIGEELDLLEAEASAGLFPVPQLGLRAGMILRGENSLLAKQTWMIPKVSLVSRASFIGDIFNTYAAFSIFPKALSRRAEGDDKRGSLFSRGGEAGVEFKLARATGLNGAITYSVEQIVFDDSERIESFSSIRLRFGFNIGR